MGGWGKQREAERRHQFSVLVSALCFHINLAPVIISMQSHHTAGKPGTGADAFVMKQCMQHDITSLTGNSWSTPESNLSPSPHYLLTTCCLFLCTKPCVI